MSQSEDNSSYAYLGGIIVFVIVVSILLRALQAFFIELSKSFDAFGKMVGSFVPMLLNILEMVGLAAAIIASVVAGVYFTYKYVKLVKRGTELREYVERELDSRLGSLQYELTAKWRDETDTLTRDLVDVRQKIESLLRPPTAAPLPVIAATTPHDAAPVTEDEAPAIEHEAKSDEDAPSSDEAQGAENAPIPVSQPY